MIKIVFFHIDKQENQTSVSDGQKNKEIVHTMIDSARKHFVDCEIVQLTDQDTDSFDGVDCVAIFGDHPEFLMPARMEYQYKYLLNHCVDGDKVIFVDPDIIFQKDLSFVFDDESFDVGLTWRDNLGKLSESMPFNAGIVFVKNTIHSRTFFQMATNMLTTAPESIKKWYGDQLAMYELVGKDNYKNRDSDIIKNFDITFKMFPCDEYNYSPVGDELLRVMNNSAGCQSVDRLKGKYVLHFKGQLKDYMNDYWNKFK